jgi:hypothetical protein
LLKSIQKWLHNNVLKKYGFGWLYRDFYLHVAICLTTYCSVSNCLVSCVPNICCQFLWIVHSVSLTFIKSFYLLSSNVWFSDVPDKDKEIDTATIYSMYVILYFIKWRNEKKIEKCKVCLQQYEFRDNFFAFFILMNSHGNEANVYEI